MSSQILTSNEQLVPAGKSFYLIPVIIGVLFVFFHIAGIEAVLFISLFTLILIYYCRNYSFGFKLVIFASFIIRVTITCIDQCAFRILQFQSDTLMYDKEALEIVQNFVGKEPLFYNILESNSVKTYSAILAFIYGVFGFYPVLARLLNTFAGVLTAILVFKISLLLFKHYKAALYAMIMVLFWPSILAFSTYALRDSILLFISFLMLYNFMLVLNKRFNLLNVLCILICFTLVYFFRIQNFFLYLGVLVLFVGILIWRSRVHPGYKWASLLVLVIAYFLAIKSAPDLAFQILSYPFRTQHLRVEGGAVYLESLAVQNFTDAFLYAPIRFIYFTFGPFLWNVRTIFQLFSAVEGLALFIVFMIFIKFFITKSKAPLEKKALFLLLFCLTGLTANALVDSNFGTAIRHRIDYVIIFFIFAGAYFNHLTKADLIANE